MKKYLFIRFLCLCAAALLYVSCAGMRGPKYPNMLADMDPFSLGSVTASLDQILSSEIREASLEVIFYPRENEVLLEFDHGVSQYWQFWNEAGRRQFIQALSSYKDDFANRRLDTRFNRSRAIYGRFKGRFHWKPLSFSPLYKASPEILLGYRFRGDAPYFSASQLRSKEETGINRGGVDESPAYSIYFTRAQGDELAHLFDQAYLLGLLPEVYTPPAASDPSRDVYIRQQ